MRSKITLSLRNKLSAFRFNVRHLLTVFLLVTIAGSALYFSNKVSAATRTWDGGGVTNNWSEAANWSGDTVPTSDDIAIFDSTSTKNCSIDVPAVLAGFNINAGYSGTISQGASNLTLTLASFTQSAGTFDHGGGTIAIEAGNFTLNNGIFNGSSGNMNLKTGTFTQNNGTFNAPQGTLAFSGYAVNLVGGTFNAPAGTISFNGYSGTFGGNCCSSIEINGSAAGTRDFFNLTFNNTLDGFHTIGTGDTMRVLGTLNLVDGDVNEGFVEAAGPVSIASTFGNSTVTGGTGLATLKLTGNQSRIVTIPSGLTGTFLKTDLNAPNTTLTTSGSGTVKMQRLNLDAGIVNTGTVATFKFEPDYQSTAEQSGVQTGGTFTCGNGTITFENILLTISGGNFDCGAATAMNMNFSDFALNGGTFTAPAGTLSFNGTGAPDSIQFNAGTFIHNNGTVVLDGVSIPGHGSDSRNTLNINGANPGTIDLFNLTVLDTFGGHTTTLNPNDTLRINGTLNLTAGVVNQTGSALTAATFELLGNVNIGSSFISTNGNNGPEMNMRFAGSGNQTYSNAGANNFVGSWTIDKPGGTVNLANDLNINNGGATNNLNLTSGTITTGNFVVNAGTRPVVRTSGHIIGNLRRKFTAAGSKTYDVGGVNYSPATVNVTTLTTNPSDLTVGVVESTQSSLSPAKSLSRFFPITLNSGSMTANLTFNYLQTDVNGDENAYQVIKVSSGVASVPAGSSVNTSANTFTAIGISSFSDWTAGVITPCVGGQKTWTGDGTTNNWSEAANWSCNAVPLTTDSVIFNANGTKNATIDTNITVAGFHINTGYSGVISQGASSVTVTSAIAGNNFTQAAGTFLGGSGPMTLTPSCAGSIPDCTVISGGSFTATSGTTTISNFFTLDSGATFNHNGGTIVASTAFSMFGTKPSWDVSSLTLADASSFSIPVNAAGTFTLGSGGIGRLINGTINASGDVVLNPNSGTNNGTLNIIGAATRSITFAAGVPMPSIVVVNAPNLTINTSGAGTTNFPSLDLQNVASATNGSVNWTVPTFKIGNTGTDSAIFTQGAGTFTSSTAFQVKPGGSFTGGNGTTTIAGLTQSGGSLNGGSGTLDLTNASTFSGGTFTASSGTTFFRGNYSFSTAAAFIHNGGTVIHKAGSFQGTATSIAFFNFTYDSAAAHNFTGKTQIVENDLNVLQGSFLDGTFDVRRHVTFAAAFTGGGGTNMTFSGTADQTFTNGSASNLTGIWTINKPSGTVTAATSMILPTTQTLNITSGTLYLNSGSNLTTGNVTIGANGRLVNDSATTITLGGALSNGGRVDLQGGGAACPGTDDILIRSSVNNIQRNWSATGTGAFRLVDVDVKDMLATSPITVFSGVGLNTNWTFNAGCPAALSISPLTVDKFVGQTQQFTASGGITPYSFSLLTNNSGGGITSPGGLYTAGSTPNVTDTIRVTDGFGTADATVNVFAGPATKLGVTVQPTNTVAGQTITPAITVAVQNSAGTTVGNATDAVTIAILNNAGSGTLAGTVTRNAVNGIATFDNLAINKAGTGYTLRVTSGSLTAANTNSFNITIGTATKLGFIVQPASTVAGVVIAPPVQVAIQDSQGNTVTTASGSITMAIETNPASGTLTGGGATNTVGGVATFSGLSINNFGNGYTLRATSGALTLATSNSFNIISPFVVINTNDSGPGSLRQVILNSNATAGVQNISFNIPGSGPFTIAPVSLLPNITGPVIIDGTTQPSFAGTPVIILSGANLSGSSTGLNISAGGSTVKGLAIIQFHSTNVFTISTAIRLATLGGNTIQGNIIGTNAANNASIGNDDAIRIETTSGNNVIGGPSPSERNIISGNLGKGITINSSNNSITGNFIGTNSSGTSALANNIGIVLFSGSNNSITGNVISGNSGIALQIGGGIGAASNNLAQSNLIGLSAAGTSPLGNGGAGVSLSPNGPQVVVNNRISENRISDNVRLGISLGASATPLTNDSLDPDSGPNDKQNYPVLSAATSFAGNTTITGTLNSTPSQSFTVEFFSSPTCDASGNGEGETYLGSSVVNTDATGIAAINATLPVGVTIGRVITTTATRAGVGTSEFSRCQVVAQQVNSISGTITEGGSPLAFAVVALSGSQTALTITSSGGTYSFNNVAAGGNYTVTPTKTNFTFTPVTRTYNNLTANQTGQDFTGTQPRFSISGHVTSSVGPTSFPLGGVVVTTSGGPSPGANSTTNNNGDYTITGLLSGTYTVTPAKPDRVFTPVSRSITITSGDQTANFSTTGLPTLLGRMVFRDSLGIRAMNADGSGLIYVAFDSNPFLFGRKLVPDISKDGRKILSSVEFNNGLLTFDPDGSNFGLALNTSNRVFLPAWSPNRSRVAFFGDIGPDFGLVTVNRDGTGPSLAHKSTGGHVSTPDWSPDGSKLVFGESDPTDGKFHIYSVNANGTGFTQLTTGSNFDASPRWAPDNSKIAFRRGVNNLAGSVIMTMDPDGSNQTPIYNSPQILTDLEWAPDSSRLAIVEGPPNGPYKLATILPNGTVKLTIVDDFKDTRIQWGGEPSVATPAGTNVTSTLGSVSVTYANAAGSNAITTITSIPQSAVGVVPGGFNFGGFGSFEISTTSVVTPPITLCFDLPTNTTQATLNALHIFHNEGGTQVDRTSSRTFQDTPTVIRRICATTTSLSPFVIGEQINPSLPSIRGLVTDSGGNPLSEVQLNLTGTDGRSIMTDRDGLFTFPNLTTGGNYNVEPRLPGYLFNESSNNFVNVAGENTVVFTGTAATVDIGGHISDGNGGNLANIQVDLSGADSRTTTTNATGYYSFTGLPADADYTVTPFDANRTFDPPSANIDRLTGSLSGVDFNGPLSCTFSLTPTTQNFTKAGGSNTVGVTASDPGCSWTAVSNDAWITVTSGASGTGNGTVGYTVAANTGNPRTGTITVGDQTFTVTQDGDCVTVSVPNVGLTAATGSTIIVPVTVSSMTGRGATAFDFTINYNASVLTPVGASNTGTMSSTYVVTTNITSPGTLVVSGFGTGALTGAGTLLNLQFTVAGSAPACSPLNFAAFTFNEGTPCVTTSNGQACAQNGTISGAVTYGNAPATAVPGVSMNVTGATTTSAITDPAGLYALSGFNNGAHTVTPAKTTDVNGITALDSALIAQHVVHIITLGSTPQIAADVSGNGTITSFDASQIAQYVALIANPSSTGTWRFIPPSRSYPSVASNQTNQNYSAVLMGEVSGNWLPPGPGPIQDPITEMIDPIAVSFPTTFVPLGGVATVPLTTGDVSNRGAIAYQFEVAFDPAVVQPQATPFDQASTLSSNMSVTVNASSPGILRIAVFGTGQLTASGTLLNLKFNVVGPVGSMTPLTITNFKYNESNPASVAANGQLTVLAPSAAGVSVGGRLTLANGRGLANARVSLTDMNGQTRTVTSTARGYYHFDDVPSGATYIVSVSSRRYVFDPDSRVLNLVDEAQNIDFVGTPR